MYTANHRPLHLSLLALACILSISACKTASIVPSKQLIVEPVVPQIRCKQQAAPSVPPAPRGDQWVEWLPPLPGAKQGVARLSEKATLWISDTMSVVAKLRGLRKTEHDCLDDAEAKGLIRQ